MSGDIRGHTADKCDEFSVHRNHGGLPNKLRRVFEWAGLDVLIGFARSFFDVADNIIRLVT
ncbi:MAG: hypothetical protein GW949_02335 [Spirochaetales bacterium]|nr:hypothetical protein [Spirochaetales bacterium]